MSRRAGSLLPPEGDDSVGRGEPGEIRGKPIDDPGPVLEEVPGRPGGSPRRDAAGPIRQLVDGPPFTGLIFASMSAPPGFAPGTLEHELHAATRELFAGPPQYSDSHPFIDDASRDGSVPIRRGPAASGPVSGTAVDR
jgi:hypothetical protein